MDLDYGMLRQACTTRVSVMGTKKIDLDYGMLRQASMHYRDITYFAVRIRLENTTFKIMMTPFHIVHNKVYMHKQMHYFSKCDFMILILKCITI